MTDFSKSLLILGSPEMIKAWNDFTKSEAKTKAALETIETLLKAVRKDLGHNDSALKDFEIINIMLTPEERI
jgi:hypothetical protein